MWRRLEVPDEFLKRSACQIVAQLPEGREDALKVLRYVNDILANLGGGWGSSQRPSAPIGPVAAQVVSLAARHACRGISSQE